MPRKKKIEKAEVESVEVIEDSKDFRSSYLASLPKNPKVPDDTVERDLEHGWMIDTLLMSDAATNKRWVYWNDIVEGRKLPEGENYLPSEPIPHVDFGMPQSNKHTIKMWERCFNSVCKAPLNSEVWMGWDSYSNFNYVMDWLLYGFGSRLQKELPKEPVERASMNLYQLFDLGLVMLFPADYFGWFFSQCRIGRQNAFFPTPAHICEMMTRMTFIEGKEDFREKTVLDPAVGTGAMLLHASNYSLRLFGQDISPLNLKACVVNGYFYCPTLALPVYPEHTLIEGNTLANECLRYWN